MRYNRSSITHEWVLIRVNRRNRGKYRKENRIKGYETMKQRKVRKREKSLYVQLRIVAMVINLLTTCFGGHRSCSDYRIVSPSSIARFPSIWRVEGSIFAFFVSFFRLFVECVERYLRHTGWSGIIISMDTLSTSYFSYDKSCV